jgi:hypothetical protein
MIAHWQDVYSLAGLFAAACFAKKSLALSW